MNKYKKSGSFTIVILLIVTLLISSSGQIQALMNTWDFSTASEYSFDNNKNRRFFWTGQIEDYLNSKLV